MPKMPEHVVDPPGSNGTRESLSLYKLRRGYDVRRAGRQQDRGDCQPVGQQIPRRLGEGENREEAAVVEILEGPLDISRCHEVPFCGASAQGCALRDILEDVNDAILRTLEGVTLADFVQRQRAKELLADDASGA